MPHVAKSYGRLGRLVCYNAGLGVRARVRYPSLMAGESAEYGVNGAKQFLGFQKRVCRACRVWSSKKNGKTIFGFCCFESAEPAVKYSSLA
jgi:hypothetical protein